MNAARTNLGEDFWTYVKRCKDAGVDPHNVINMAAHWLYGTDPNTLATLLAEGLVYSPPGH